MVHFNSIRQRLIELARKGEITTYSDLERDCNIPNPSGDANLYLFDLLYDLGSFEALFERPPINALVVKKKVGIPGDGFYKWDRLRLRRFDKLNQVDILMEYKVICSQYWQNEENYRVYSGAVNIEYK